ncbi:MAG: hypothetical protein SVX43_03640 [Cyanobacteriota bacterium]|nr:hypothetical protein [Cyanobacteriota bacterium]
MRAGALALALTAILLPACANNTEEPEVTEPNATEPEVTDSNATVEDVAENADELFGQVVTVRGEPDEILDNVSFTLSDDEFFGGDEILIVNSSGEPFTLPEDGTNIQVTGEVRQFSAFDFEEEFELDWTPAEDYGERPTIVAQSIAISPEPGEVTGNPEEYYGQTVAVEGEVEEVADATTFTLEEEQLVGGENLTVINLTEPAQGIEEGNQIVVTGQVRPFVLAEIEKDYDLTWDLELKEKLEAEYSNKPVLVATGIYPSATEE